MANVQVVAAHWGQYAGHCSATLTGPNGISQSMGTGLDRSFTAEANGNPAGTWTVTVCHPGSTIYGTLQNNISLEVRAETPDSGCDADADGVPFSEDPDDGDPAVP